MPPELASKHWETSAEQISHRQRLIHASRYPKYIFLSRLHCYATFISSDLREFSLISMRNDAISFAFAHFHLLTWIGASSETPYSLNTQRDDSRAHKLIKRLQKRRPHKNVTEKNRYDNFNYFFLQCVRWGNFPAAFPHRWRVVY